MSVSYEHIVSRGAYGEIGNNVYERMRERYREIWFGSDDSGLISETFIRSSFFSDDQRIRWAGAYNRGAREDPAPSTDLSAAGCLPGRGHEFANFLLDPGSITRHLEARRRPLHEVGQLLGEALVPDELGHLLYQAASQLSDVQILDIANDELGRTGHALVREERGRRVELIFSHGGVDLVGEREILLEATDYAPANSLIGWSSYLTREVVPSLPASTPPIPFPPCSDPGVGRGTSIDKKFVLGTGYFTDLDAQLEIWREQGVITQAQLEGVKARSQESN